jgi:hypothetical protein
MRFATLSAALAFVASAIAQTAGFDAITSPTQWEKVAAGKTFTIKWQPGDVTGTVTIGLIGGVAQEKQVPLSTIASGVNNQDGTFTWTVDASLGKDAVYGLKISLDSNPETFQYSFPFNIEAGAAPAPVASSSSAAAPAVSTKASYETEPVPTSKPVESVPATTAASSTQPASASTYPASASVPATTAVKPTASYPASNTTAPASGSSTLSTATHSASATSNIVPVSGAGRVAAGSFLLGGAAVLAACL